LNCKIQRSETELQRKRERKRERKTEKEHLECTDGKIDRERFNVRKREERERDLS